MKRKRLLKIKGYLYMLRRLILLFNKNGFDFADLGFLVFLILEADWDKRHSSFGCVDKTESELAIDARCDPSTINRRKKAIQKHGLVELKDGLIRINDFEKYTYGVAIKLGEKDVANLQEDNAQTQEVIAEMHRENAGMQESSQESDSPFNVSSKDNLSLNNNEVDLDDLPF